jgi:hypothetical protein
MPDIPVLTFSLRFDSSEELTQERGDWPVLGVGAIVYNDNHSVSLKRFDICAAAHKAKERERMLDTANST